MGTEYRVALEPKRDGQRGWHTVQPGTAVQMAEQPAEPKVRQTWRHTRTGTVIEILAPKLDTADEWYVANKDGFRGTLTTAQITEEHILEYPRR